MKKFLFVLALANFLFTARSMAQIKNWSINDFKKGELVYKKSGLTPKLVPQKVSDLQKMREFEVKGEFSKCIESGQRAVIKVPQVKEWIFAESALCALKWLEFDPVKGRGASMKVLAQVEKSLGSVPTPAEALLKKRYKELLLALLENDFLNKRNDWAIIDKLSEIRSWMTKEEKAKLYRNIAENLFKTQKLDLARDYFQKSLAESPSEDVKNRLTTVESALNVKAATEVTNKEFGVKEEVIFSKLENELYARVQNAIKANDVVTATEDGVQLILQFSSGSRAKWVTDKLIELLLLSIDKEGEMSSVVKKMLGQMAKVDGVRAFAWSQSLMRQANYFAARELAEAALSKSSASAQLSKIIDVVAYSQFVLGNYKDAKKHYVDITENHVGSSEYLNALFMAGMAEIRLGEWAGAARFFERILIQEHPTNLNVKTRYWLWRSLEKIDPSRAQAEASSFQARYPLSYYGLRALSGASAQIQLAQIVTNTKFSEQFASVSTDTKAIEKFILLSDAGWMQEAQDELSSVDFSSSVKGLIPMAHLWSKAGQFSKSIQILNRVWESDVTLINGPLLRLAYPKPYWELVDAQAKIRKLEPNLVLSLMRQESAFSPTAVSTSNALGLMQMIPKTAQETAKELGVKVNLPESLMDPETNIQFCTYYLAKMITQFEGNVPWGLAAYNAGPTRIKKWLKARNLVLKASSDPIDEAWIDELPWDETQFYVKAILRNLILYRLLDGSLIKLNNPIWTP